MIVTYDNINEVLAHLSTQQVIGLDTETYGLKWDDKLFALQLGCLDGRAFYFNFHEYGVDSATPVLSRSIFETLQEVLFSRPNVRWIIHNSKFDMRRLDIEGCFLNGQIWDTMIIARLVRNDHFSYSLDNCLKRIGMAKDDRVKEWITQNKAYTTRLVDGKKTKEKDLHFDRVPFPIMYEYGLSDVTGMLALYVKQMEYLSENHDMQHLAENDCEIVKTVFAMEKRGIKLLVDYCNNGYEYEMNMVTEIAKHIEALTNRNFEGGPKWLKAVLDEQGVDVKKSEKGNPILDKKSLKGLDNAITNLILEMRDREKRATAFYGSLGRIADNDGVVHADYRIAGTDTGRFSCSNPNLQQIPKEEKLTDSSPFIVRRAFVPREGYILVAMDYDQMEYRMMADYAGEMGMIKAIIEGMDPHTYVGTMMGVDRKPAKTLNFGLLYGMGLAKLAEALNVLVDKAKELKTRYYSELPAVKQLHADITAVARSRGFIRNKYGRRYYLQHAPDGSYDFAYKLVNYLIQGSGADVVKHAMNKIAYYLEMTKSHMLLQVHDELIFEIHETELHLIPELKRIMEVEYKPINGMHLTCGVSWSAKSWAVCDMIDGVPTLELIKEQRDAV